MKSLKFTVEYQPVTLRKMEKEAQDCLFLTAEALHTKVVQAQVMPFDTGTMQNTATSVQKIDDNHVQLQTVTPYARRLYYHPEYKFQKTSNPNAQGRWLDEWIVGNKKGYCKRTFRRLFKKRWGKKP